MAGSRCVHAELIGATRPGGHVGYVGYVGVSHGVELPGQELFFSAVHLHGGPAPVRRFLPELIELICNRAIDPGKVFDLTLPLDGNVHFTPGARTAWHAHAIAQTLYVTEGEGLAQARGEAVIKIRPGDVVAIAGNEWHWHGAAPGHPMTHLSLAEGGTELGDHVTDAEYNSD